MVRAPCCEKVGLKKGPWSAEEDQILIQHIQRFGHPNWRALPKQAGLLRCGKSCRLRWTNYLRPDIKRGNFTSEEEDAIISLHAELGNKWSAIAAKLPGRTDNEIKNVWHTHLKKRLNSPKELASAQPSKKKIKTKLDSEAAATNLQKPDLIMPAAASGLEQSCSSATELSSINGTDSRVMPGDHITANNYNNGINDEISFSSEKFEGLDDNFWSETLLINDDHNGDSSAELMSLASLEAPYLFSSTDSYDMEFWLNVFREAEYLDI
ncbi:hypothetical protein Cni_G18374 [Canna indica]|uniref:Uncharacterized protein n=1 Tax=Canna indica TaxID=4628 RepID=A0AAQ3QEA7_9LILI|nr:hypothetical protein Cni_G18374 [Canna indica]